VVCDDKRAHKAFEEFVVFFGKVKIGDAVKWIITLYKIRRRFYNGSTIGGNREIRNVVTTGDQARNATVNVQGSALDADYPRKFVQVLLGVGQGEIVADAHLRSRLAGQKLCV